MSSSQTSTATQARNPITLRLYKVLGTRFDDAATKEALQTLSALYAAPTTSKGKDKEVDVAPEDDRDDEDVNRYHADISVVDSAVRARKFLRRDMEQKLAEGSRQFLAAFRQVDQRLSELQDHITAMRASCDEAERQLGLSNESSRTLLERAGSLREERHEIVNKKSIVSAFLARFTLTEEEQEALSARDRDVPIGNRFFLAMDKASQIRKECRVLMSADDVNGTSSTQAGLDIMASTASYLEQGYEKILRWLAYEFRLTGKAAENRELEVTPTLQEAVQRLRHRPELLTEALTTLSQTRQATLSSSFLAALTRGGPSGLPRPIELHAHDPMRYVGDMLAWVHQAIAAEREFLESLFGIQSDGRMVGSVRTFQRHSEEESWMMELMDLAVEKLCIPLKIRVQQTIKSQESSIVSYKIANLLQFYKMTMRRTIGEDALLSKTLKEITDLAYKTFYDALEAQSQAIVRIGLDIDDTALTPQMEILDHAQVLREIISVYQSSLAGDEDAEEQAAGAERVLDLMVDPAVYICVTLAGQKMEIRPWPRWDAKVFVVNCVSYLSGVLEPFSFSNKKRRELQEIIDERLRDLTEEYYHNIMLDAGLARCMTALEDAKPGEPLSHIPSMQPVELQASLHTFSQWLSSVEVVQSQRLSQLSDQRLHTQVHREALRRMALGYRQICEAVRRPENRYEAASTFLGSERPFGQVHLLWQIFGLEDSDQDG